MRIVELILRSLCLLCTSLFSIVFSPKDSFLSRKSVSQRQLCEWGGFSTSARSTPQNGFPFITLTHWCWSNLAVSDPILLYQPPFVGPIFQTIPVLKGGSQQQATFAFFNIPITQHFSRGRLKITVSYQDTKNCAFHSNKKRCISKLNRSWRSQCQLGLGCTVILWITTAVLCSRADPAFPKESWDTPCYEATVLCWIGIWDYFFSGAHCRLPITKQ